jgi:DNA mismatch repair protein MutS2
MVDEAHFTLDKLLNRTEQDLQKVQEKEKELHRLMKENERLKKEMEQVLDKERHRQQVELLKQQNKITEDRLTYLKDMERKLKTMVVEWRKAEEKDKVVKEMAALLFGKKNEQKTVSKKQKQLDSRFEEIAGDIQVGDKVKMKRNLQVGEVLELRGKKAVVKIGLLPMQIDMADLVKIKEKAEP